MHNVIVVGYISIRKKVLLTINLIYYWRFSVQFSIVIYELQIKEVIKIVKLGQFEFESEMLN